MNRSLVANQLIDSTKVMRTFGLPVGAKNEQDLLLPN
jgi:hypothetical protein